MPPVSWDSHSDWLGKYLRQYTWKQWLSRAILTFWAGMIFSILYDISPEATLYSFGLVCSVASFLWAVVNFV